MATWWRSASDFRTEVATLLQTEVNPAARALLNTLRALASIAPNAVGWGQYPGGKDAYRIVVKQMATLEVTPEEVHRLGLEFIEANEREMAATGAPLPDHAALANCSSSLRVW